MPLASCSATAACNGLLQLHICVAHPPLEGATLQRRDDGISSARPETAGPFPLLHRAGAMTAKIVQISVVG